MREGSPHGVAPLAGDGDHLSADQFAAGLSHDPMAGHERAYGIAAPGAANAHRGSPEMPGQGGRKEESTTPPGPEDDLDSIQINARVHPHQGAIRSPGHNPGAHQSVIVLARQFLGSYASSVPLHKAIVAYPQTVA